MTKRIIADESSIQKFYIYFLFYRRKTAASKMWRCEKFLMERRMLVGVSLLFCILLRRMLENEMQSMLINKEYRIRIYLKRLHTMWNNTYKEIETRWIYYSCSAKLNHWTTHHLTFRRTVWSGRFLRTPMYPPVLTVGSTRSPYGENKSILYVDARHSLL